MKDLLALTIQKVVEAKGYTQQNEVRKAYDALWDGIRLIHALEFDLYPEHKHILFPLRLSLETLAHPLQDVLENHVFPDRYWRKLWCVEEREKFNQQYHVVMLEFQSILSFTLSSEVLKK